MNIDELSELRRKIDEIDSRLIEVLASRIDIIREIGAIKRSAGLPAKDDARWQEVVQKAKQAAVTKNVPESLVDEVFAAIHRAALEIEEKNI